MPTRIFLGPALSDRAQAFLRELADRVAHAPDRKNEITAEIAELTVCSSKLAGEIDGLKREAMHSDEATGNLMVKEARARKVEARLAELRQALARLRPITLAGAGELVRAITVKYGEQLPDVIREIIGPVCPEYARATPIVQLTGAMRTLRYWVNRSYTIDGELATSREADTLAAILRRALAGAPHLGMEIAPEPQPASQATPPPGA